MLTIENASLHYGAAQALRGVSLQVEPKSITCILGRNGVGKTSMLRAIVGQHPLSSGSISFEGSVLGRKPPYDRARAGIAFGGKMLPNRCEGARPPPRSFASGFHETLHRRVWTTTAKWFGKNF